MINKTMVFLICIFFISSIHSTIGLSIELDKISDNEYENFSNNKIIDFNNFDPVEVIDQQQTSTIYLGCPFFGNIWLAQGFIPSLETLTKVELKLFKNGNPTSPITISIRNSLNGEDLTSATIDGNLVSEYSKWLEFDFSDIIVNPGNDYFIVCRTSGGSIFNYYCNEFNTENPYEGGEAWGSDDSGSTWDLIENHFPEYPDPDACFKTYGFDEPPEIPEISGEINGNVGTEYTYTFSTTDFEGHEVYYYIEWGDGSNSGWLGPYASGTLKSVSHTWSVEGSYKIRIKAKDSYGLMSNWGELDIFMPKINRLNIQIIKILQQYSILLPIFQYFRL